jgi:ATP-dependent DNA helicase RecG
VALREAWINAVIHRDYESNTPTMITFFSDRMEILSPGGLYDLPRAAFPGATAYRNPVLAEAAKVLGYVNRFGRGIPRIEDALRRKGSEAPRFEPSASHFLVTIARRP